ncbi:hypothetical protein PVAND_003149 [Polypedilum vanderplanki]|uniref:Uncharacterized protein n=1 Tax=Polypedilum vanderplanki TaxID=319348 RepID=A0A9J6BTL3_POLVA|nr:hypothetical protein PVAND_003149 [Polypedilum vanderplanki]
MSILNEQAETALTEFEKVIQLLSDYQTARGNYRMKKIDIEGAEAAGEIISDADLTQLTKLEKACDDVRINLCERIPIVHEQILEAIDAMKNNADGHEIDIDLYDELQEKLTQLPTCPSKSDFMNISVISACESIDDEIIFTSDSDQDERREINEEINELLGIAKEKADSLSEMRIKMKELEEMKKTNKAEMFALRDQNKPTEFHQNIQRQLFDQLNELKINSKRLQAETGKLIVELMQKVTDNEQLEMLLMEMLHNVNDENSINISRPDDEILQPVPRSLQTRLLQPGSRLPQPPSRLPARTQTVQSRIPQMQSQIPQTLQPQSRLPQPHTRLPQPRQTHLPQRQPIAAIQRPIHIENTAAVAQIQSRQIQSAAQQQPMSRILQPSNIKKQTQQRKIPSMKQPVALKVSDSIGNARRVVAKPNLSNRNIPKTQRKPLAKKETPQDDLQKKLKEAELIQARMIAKMSIDKRKEEEKEAIDHLLNSILKYFFKNFEPDFEESFSHEEKMKYLEEKMKVTFENIVKIMKQYRGAGFVPDEATNNNFIRNVLNHFDINQDFHDYHNVLSEFFKRIPYPPFKLQKKKQIVDPKLQQTASKIQRPRTQPSGADKQPALLKKRPVTSTPSNVTKTNVEKQMKSLAKENLQKSFKSQSTKDKLDTFATNFCKLFIKNQKNRRNRYDIWVKIFRDHLNPILNDLDSFYKSMPYPEFQNFNRKQVEESLDRLLFHVYEETKRFDITNIKCKDLIGNELTKVMERKHLSKLNKSMGIFLQGVKELMEPYINELENEAEELQQSVKVSQQLQQSINVSNITPRNIFGQKSVKKSLTKPKSHVASFLQKNKTRDETEDSIEVPSFNDDESLTSKMPVKELQALYRQIAAGNYRQPPMVGTARQVQNMDRVTSKLRTRAEKDALLKRDKSLMRVQGDVDQTFEGSIIQSIAPTAMTIFKRIVGNNEKIKLMHVNNDVLKALDIVLELCEDVDMQICTVLTQNDRSQYIIKDPIRKSIEKLLNQISTIIYQEGDGLNVINKLYKYFDRLDSNKMYLQLENIRFTNEECEQMLASPFSIVTNERNAIALEFIKDLRYLELKCVKEIIKGQFRDEIAPLANVTAVGENLYLDNTKARQIVSRLRTIKTNHPVRILSRNAEYPSNLLERDILYVACQLVHRNIFLENLSDDDIKDDEFSIDHMDYVSKFTINIAKSFQEGKLTEHDALRVIRQLIHLVPCIPQSFYNTFIYHVDNEYFKAIRFEDPQLNAAIRNNLLFSTKNLCADDKVLFRLEQNVIINRVETFMRLFDNDLNTLAYTMQEVEKLTAAEAKRIEIVCREIANNGNGVLGVPNEINIGNALEGNVNNQLNDIVSDQIPQCTVAFADINNEIEKIDKILQKQNEEEDHFENSRIAKISRKYELQPAAMKRKNYFQSRGSEWPNWFPGFYSVFSDSYLSKPVLYSSPFQLLYHAWRTMAPVVKQR